MTTATLSKWGNSQGIIIPKSVCELLGFEVGDELSLRTNGQTLEVEAAPRTFHRAKKTSIEELFAGWEGEYCAPGDFPSIGNEIDWGAPVGKEMW